MVAFEHPPGCGQGAGADAPDSHDMRLRRVWEALQRDSRPPEGLAGVHAAATLIQNLAHRVGALPFCQLHSEDKMVAVECPALVGRWNGDVNCFCDPGAIQEPVEFHGSQTSESEALRMGLVPSEPSRTPHFCKGAGVHYPRCLHDRRARCTVGNSVCVDHFASGASERSPTCDEGKLHCHKENNVERCPTWGS